MGALNDRTRELSALRDEARDKGRVWTHIAYGALTFASSSVCSDGWPWSPDVHTTKSASSAPSSEVGT